MSTRILVADDSVQWRGFVSLTVKRAADWHIVGEASDGPEAVQKAKDLTPDLILLDIGLPTLNGIEGARQIRKLVPQSKILFLSGLHDPDIVQEAMRTGASGYVVKLDAASELTKAIEDILRGKQYVSSRIRRFISKDTEDSQTPGGPIRKENLTSSPVQPAIEAVLRGRHFIEDNLEAPQVIEVAAAQVSHHHDIVFYSSDVGFLKGLADFILRGLGSGKTIIAVATMAHRESLVRTLKARGLDVEGAIRGGVYLELDSADTLSAMTVNGVPDRKQLFEKVGGVIDAAARAQKPSRGVSACGEVAPLLLAKGEEEAAIQVEHLWDDLIKTRGVDLLCAYPLSSFRGGQGDQAFKSICAVHSTVHFR